MCTDNLSNETTSVYKQIKHIPDLSSLGLPNSICNSWPVPILRPCPISIRILECP
jgi:hypothetical protein